MNNHLVHRQSSYQKVKNVISLLFVLEINEGDVDVCRSFALHVCLTESILQIALHDKTLLSHSVLTMSEKMQLHKVEDL